MPDYITLLNETDIAISQLCRKLNFIIKNDVITFEIQEIVYLDDDEEMDI